MGVPVAKTQGMKTGASGHSDLQATSTGNETRFSSTGPLRRSASPRDGIAALRNGRICRGRYRKIANEPSRRACRADATSPHQIMPPINLGGAIASDLPPIANGIREKAPPRGGASFLFERGLRPTKSPRATSATSMMECTTTWRAIAHRAIRGWHDAHPSHARRMKHQAASRSLSACG